MKAILFTILSLLTISCTTSLDVAPRGYVSSGTFYKNETDIRAALIGAYSVLQEVYRNEHILTPNEICADNAIPFLTGGADRVALWRYTHNTTNIYPGQIWSSAYKGIQYSNVLIDRIGGVPMDNTVKEQYIAEAKYLRALHYFNLVRFFGDIPLVKNETTDLSTVNIPRSPTNEVYTFIEQDLQVAESVLPPDYNASDKGRATQTAAKALLADVYLTWAGNSAGSAQWAKAVQKAKDVIDSRKYELWQDYADVYKLANRGGKESIFEVQFVTDLLGNGFTTGYAPRGAPIVPNNGFGIFRVTKNLFDQYSVNDKRKNVTFLTSYVNPTNGQTVQLSTTDPDPALAISFWKLADPTVKIGLNGGTSWPYMRYSEVLLIYAEALNEVNNGPNQQAYDAINAVRNRAGLTSVSGLNKTEFLSAILQERRLEFCFEGQRWFDLARRKLLKDAVVGENSFARNVSFKEDYYLFPLPFREMEANPSLVQNPGYN